MPRQFVYDYYKIKIPGDLYDKDEEDAIKFLGEAAITEAREQSRLYCIPATWTATLVSGEPGDFLVTFLVRRKRYRHAKKTEHRNV